MIFAKEQYFIYFLSPAIIKDVGIWGGNLTKEGPM